MFWCSNDGRQDLHDSTTFSARCGQYRSKYPDNLAGRTLAQRMVGSRASRSNPWPTGTHARPHTTSSLGVPGARLLQRTVANPTRSIQSLVRTRRCRSRADNQVVDEEFHHPILIHAAVPAIRSHLYVETLPGLLQRLDQLHHVRRVDIVVRRAVIEQQLSLQVLRI